VTYDPMRRWTAMAKHVREPRGSKSIEHLEILRQSDPTPGTLLPLAERVGVHELPYQPNLRFVFMAKHLSQPRGFKDSTHLAILRRSNPLAGVIETRARQWTERGPAAGWLKTEMEDATRSGAEAHALNSLQQVASDEADDKDAESPDEASTSTSDSWQMLRTSRQRLPRILSNQELDMLDDDDGSLDALGEPNTVWPRSVSFDSDELDDESVCSAAMTHERTSRTSERASNDTIVSFLEDGGDYHEASPSPPPKRNSRSPLRRGEGTMRWVPPRGVMSHAEVAARAELMARMTTKSQKETAEGFKGKGRRGRSPPQDPLGKEALQEII